MKIMSLMTHVIDSLQACRPPFIFETQFKIF